MSDQKAPESSDPDHLNSDVPFPASISQPVAETERQVEPMTMSLLGRLFGIPFLIIGVIVGGAVIVVFTFGAPSAQQDRSVDELLTALEAGTGGKSLGMLLPRDKQHWQTGLELTMRLDKKGEFSDSQLREVATRLSAMIERELDRPEPQASRPGGNDPVENAREHRMAFLIRALGKTGRPEAIDPLLAVASRGAGPFAAIAMAALGSVPDADEHERAVPIICRRLAKTKSAEVKIVACTVLSVLANPGDQSVVDVLVSALMSQEGEVSWSAALALGRLGHAAGKSTLIELLDRSFWESGDRYQVTNESGDRLAYRMPEDRIDRYLIAAIDASSKLSDPEVWQMIGALQDDPRPSVRAKAKDALASRRESGE